MLRAPQNWYGFVTTERPDEEKDDEAVTVTQAARRKAWARLLAKVYEIDVLQCPQCGGRMAVIAVIQDPEYIRKIIFCMENQSRGPPEAQQTIISPMGVKKYVLEIK